MKNTSIITLAALLLGSTGAFAQEAVTKPAGFVTHTLKSGQFNLVGLTLHQPVLVAGAFETVTSNDNGTPGSSSPEVDDDYSVLTDSQVDFDNVLTSGKTYILEITEASVPALVGTIQEVTVWSGNTITTPQDLGAQGVIAGDKYQIREAAILQQIFGTPPVIKGSGSESNADVIWVPNGIGTFVRYFYKTSLGGGASWHNATTNMPVVGDIPIVYSDAIMVHVKSASPDVSLVVTGAVKTGEVSLAVFSGFNLVSNVYPVGSTLQNSGISANLKSTASEASSDVIWLPDANGNFIRYYYRTPLGGSALWYNASTGTPAAADIPLTSAFFIKRAAGAINIDLDPPSNYSNL